MFWFCFLINISVFRIFRSSAWFSPQSTKKFDLALEGSDFKQFWNWSLISPSIVGRYSGILFNFLGIVGLCFPN